MIKIRCQALNQDGKRCKNIARYKEHYIGDPEIYSGTNLEWCEIFVCRKHLKTHTESENFAGKINNNKDLFI